MILELYPSTLIIIITIIIFLGFSYVGDMFFSNIKSSFDFFAPFKTIRLDKLFERIFDSLWKLLNKIPGLNIIEVKKK